MLTKKEDILKTINHEVFAWISCSLILFSNFPYLWGIYNKKTEHSFSAWLIWLLIGFSVLVTYKTSNAKGALLSAVFGFLDPLLIILFLLWKKSGNFYFKKAERLCFGICITVIFTWVIFGYIRENTYVEKYSLYFAIATDAIAAIIQFRHVKKNPGHEKPFAWGIYAIGYGLTIFCVPEFSLENCILPTYMCVTYSGITIPLIQHRIRNGKTWRDWI